jgi:hypothetical protein
MPYFPKGDAKGIGSLAWVESEVLPEVRVGQDIKLNARAVKAEQGASSGTMPAAVGHPGFFN